MSRKYSPELRERALRMLAEARPEHPNLTSAARHVAGPLGMSPETLRLWQRREEIDARQRTGVTTDAAAEIKRLKKENTELRRANEMADSTGGRNEFGELLRWCQIAEGFAGSGVERVLDRDQFGTTDEAQIGALRQVLA